MIRAGVEDGAWLHPPPLLREYWQFTRYHLPPNPGGLRDQPLGWLATGEDLDALWRAWRAWEAGDKSAAWSQAHADIWPLVKWLRKIIYE